MKCFKHVKFEFLKVSTITFRRFSHLYTLSCSPLCHIWPQHFNIQFSASVVAQPAAMASSSLLALPGASSLAYNTLPTTRTVLEPKKPNSSSCLKARCSNSSLAQPPAEPKSTSAPAATIMSCSRRELLSAAMAALGGAVVAAPPQAEAAASGQATCGTYNVSPSGLAYCDSSVGQGVAASKGLLIKVREREIERDERVSLV